MKIDYPSQEEIQIQCKQILDNLLPKPMSFCEKIRKEFFPVSVPCLGGSNYGISFFVDAGCFFEI